MKLLARGRRWLPILGAVVIVYLLLAYLILPEVWTHHEREPGLASLPMVTRTAAGISATPNVGIGRQQGKTSFVPCMRPIGFPLIRSRCGRVSKSSTV